METVVDVVRDYEEASQFYFTQEDGFGMHIVHTADDEQTLAFSRIARGDYIELVDNSLGFELIEV